MPNLEYTTLNSLNEYKCLQPWEREWVEKERRKEEWKPEEIRIPLYEEPPEYQTPKTDDDERGVVIIEL